MSQDYTSVTKRRRARRNHNRPVLVTDTLQNENGTAEGLTNTETLVAEPEPIDETPITEPTPDIAKRPSRLPRFFSKVEKSEEEDTPSAEDIAQARLARVKRNNKQAATTTTETTSATATAEESKKTGRPTTFPTQRPASMFKTKHIIGFAIYLFAAEFALPWERTLSINLHIDSATTPLTTLNLGSLHIPVYAWTLMNIITLVVLLYVLSRFDFLPNSKQLAAQRAAQGNARGTTSGQNTSVEKVAPPTMRQGVQGEDDDLYQAYRLNQRRDKKR
jgi:hypothetical protein